MQNTAANLVQRNTPTDNQVEMLWRQALPSLQRRSGVLFLSYCRFWEQHAQPQQSLAKCLVKEGIPVTWLDGSDWRRYTPTLYFRSPKLRVHQLPQVPGRRYRALNSLNIRLQADAVKAELKRLGPNPIIWVQGGIDIDLADRLPYVDVFSVFDDPYRHIMNDPLCLKARVIVTQNSFAQQTLGEGALRKSFVSLPPVEVEPDTFQEQSPLLLPNYFPKTRLGYIGSFFYHDFDLELFSDMVKERPDFGFFLMGRTDEKGQRVVDKLRRFPNFWAQPWVPRSQVASAWKSLSASLLLYRDVDEQRGAFPTKILESFYFGVPAVATRLPKTQDLEGWVERSSDMRELLQMAEKATQMTAQQKADAYRHFWFEMNPKVHLSRVVQALNGAA